MTPGIRLTDEVPVKVFCAIRINRCQDLASFVELLPFCILATMRIPCLLYPYFIVMILILFSGCGFSDGAVLPFIKSVSPIAIPSRTRIIAEFDQGEIEAVGKYQFEREDLGLFLSSHSFRVADKELPWISHFNHYTKGGQISPLDSIPFSEMSHLRYFYGCKPGNSWLFTVDVRSGALWVEVQYPDFGGLGPSCPM